VKKSQNRHILGIRIAAAYEKLLTKFCSHLYGDVIIVFYYSL